jgi:NAD(P)-dependent dehydrogenase (short-subunit alcohol dehydrogenase family)
MGNNSVVLITGASHGIGRAAAGKLAQAGFTVYGTSRWPQQQPAPAGVKMLELDVNSDASVAACAQQVFAEAGHIDVLVNNAGYAQRGPLEDVTVEQLKAQYETNVFGVHRLVRAVLPQMAQHGGGRIINISSAIGRVAIPLAAAYCSSKFALEGYSEGLAKELLPHNIRVILVEPGLTDTEFHERSQPVEQISVRYEAQISQGTLRSQEMLRHADTADTVAGVILQAATDADPKLRYACPAAVALVAQAGAERL